MTQADLEPEEKRDGFYFFGNQLVLDLLNTRPVVDGETIELLTDPERMVAWFEAAGELSGRDARRLRRSQEGELKSVLEQVRTLREQLRTDVFALEDGRLPRPGTIAELNRLMEAHPARHTLVSEEGHLTLKRQPLVSARELPARLAESAAELFTADDPRRVRKCDGCAAHFRDISKKGNRRWCSMRLCGNRAKAAAFYRRMHAED
jgi:predicted RNA-binding Zn ribbon-like protein